MTKEHIFSYIYLATSATYLGGRKTDLSVLKKLCYFGMMFSFDGCCCL